MAFEVSEVDKESDTWGELYDLFRVTDPHNLGYGRDVRSSEDYTGLTPVCAWSVEAPSRFKKYCAATEEIQELLESGGLDIPEVKTKLDEKADKLLEDGLNDSVNEKLLLHGTKPETLLTLLQNGLSERFSNGLFGSGSYLAEDPSKIDQYCTPDKQEGESLKLLHEKLFVECDVKPVKNMFYALVCRVALGHPVFTKDGIANSQPPHNNIFVNDERRELALIPSDGDLPCHYHSLIVECGPPSEGYKCARHREFIVFDSARISEEWIIGYIRDLAPPNPGAVPQQPGDSEGGDEAAEAEGGARAAKAPAVQVPIELFPVEGLPSALGIAVSPCGTFALVGNNSLEEANWKVGHIDLRSGKLSFPYGTLSGWPWSVAIAPDCTFALVVDRKEDYITRIDIPDGKLTQPYAKLPDDGLTPNQVAIAPCGTFALVACEESQVAHIDLSSSSAGSVTLPYEELDFNPQGIAIAPSGRFAILSQESGIARLDLITKSLEDDIIRDGRLGSSSQVAISRSGSFALIAAHPCHARFDLRTDDITFVDEYAEDGLKVEDPMGLSIAPSENYALVTCNKAGKVFCISNSMKAWKPLPAPDYTVEQGQSKKCCAIL